MTKKSDKIEQEAEQAQTEAAESKLTAEEKAAKTNKYYEAVGRRKTATARVRIYTKGSGWVVNDKNINEYFSENLINEIEAPLKKMKSLEKFRISIMVKGGGIRGQAEAIRHGVARALVVFNADFKKRLKRAGYIKRDPRRKERKKYGLKKSRKAPRWAKR